jgi:hypothetical protein
MMTSDRLERAVQSMHSIAMSMATLVVAAIGADKANSSFDLGGLSHLFLYASLACFAVTALAGGHLITTLPLRDGQVDEVMKQPAPLVGGHTRGLLAFPIGVWREIQHWFLIIAVVLGVLGGLAVASADASTPAPSAPQAATSK